MHLTVDQAASVIEGSSPSPPTPIGYAHSAYDRHINTKSDLPYDFRKDEIAWLVQSHPGPPSVREADTQG